MIRVLFVCHGNICRSPMAEFVFKNLVKQSGHEKEFIIESAATSTESIGNGVHSGTRKILDNLGISYTGKISIQLSKNDYNEYDYLIGMDSYNIKNMQKMLGHDKEKKIYKLLDFTNNSRDISDPWYTGDFDKTYDDVYEGCVSLLKHIVSKEL